MNKRLKMMLEATLIGVLSYVLATLIPSSIGPITIILGMIPFVLYSVKRGWKASLLAASIWSGIGLLLGHSQFLSLSQGLMEYVVAILFGSVAGLFCSPMQQALKQHNHPAKTYAILAMASITSCVSRFFWHFIAGIIFWGSYAPKGMNVWLYSLVVNGLSGLLTSGVVIIIGILMIKTNHQLLQNR